MAESDLERITQKDRQFNKASHRRHLQDPPESGLHLAVDFSRPNAFTWATVDLITALIEQGESVSIPKGPLADHGIPAHKARMLEGLMGSRPRGTFHVKWSHYWPQHLKEPLFGEVNAEFFCTNYRYHSNRQLDFWSRHVQVNGYRKLPVSLFNQEVLQDFGFEPEECPIVSLGYSPEIQEMFPDGRQPSGRSGTLRILMVTNSNDLYRYGTDLAVKALAKAYLPGVPVVVHIKDYGASSGSRQLKEWIAAQPHFPSVEWHNDFLPKEDLLRLYASMDLLLAPFRGEGFSMKVLDAMAIGVPVMMPYFGGPTEFSPPGTFLPLEHRK